MSYVNSGGNPRARQDSDAGIALPDRLILSKEREC